MIFFIVKASIAFLYEKMMKEQLLVGFVICELLLLFQQLYKYELLQKGFYYFSFINYVQIGAYGSK